MSSTNQNQTKSNNNSSKSGKRTAVPQLSQPPRPIMWLQPSIFHMPSLLLPKKVTGHLFPLTPIGNASKGQEGRKMNVKQPTASAALQGGGDVAMEVEQKSDGKKNPKKNTKKHGHQDKVEETAGTETGRVSEAVSQSKHQKKSHKDPLGHRWYSPPKEIPTRKHGPKAAKGKGKVTTTEDDEQCTSGNGRENNSVSAQGKQDKTGETKKIFPKLADCVMLSKDVVPNIKKTEITEADM
ncbi:hypothetical protein BKA82DRAFT_4346437 [Pisolithus tinctorius]|nr:hypothetical protein BKA82DRAFT_4346437 [Pisolithus tinctorius]